MARELTLSLEPADAVVGLLRLRAAQEAARWPTELSSRIRAAVDREFAQLEPFVRVVGVCYEKLEERGVARVDRSPPSRFDDVNNAMHLASCPTSVSLDLEHLRLALERGDAPARESAGILATSLRMLLWYLVRTDLLVCPRLTLQGADQPPERALRFVDAFLSAAWRPGAPPDPPLVLRADQSGVDDVQDLTGLGAADLARLAEGAEPNAEPTAIFAALVPDAVSTSAATQELHRLRIGTELTPPIQRSPLRGPQGAIATGDDDVALPDSRTVHSFLAPELDVRGATVRFPGEALLSEDARFLLGHLGLPWPCDLATLEDAWRELEASQPDSPREWQIRWARGRADLHALLGH